MGEGQGGGDFPLPLAPSHKGRGIIHCGKIKLLQENNARSKKI
jgi:hypothetical protein